MKQRLGSGDGIDFFPPSITRWSSEWLPRRQNIDFCLIDRAFAVDACGSAASHSKAKPLVNRNNYSPILGMRLYVNLLCYIIID